MAAYRHKAAGFSLIELLTVLVIMATLLGLAMPAYNSYLQKTRRSDAKSALLQLAAAQERWFFQNNQYTSTLSDLGNATSPEGYYTITLAATASTYTLTATATGKQSGDTDCQKFFVDETGDKTAQDSSSTDNTANCW